MISQPDAGTFLQSWRADVLKGPPLIAPVRQFVYPQNIAGEEEALARGALNVLVRPAKGGQYLATYALGYTDPSMPSGIYACPHPDHLCALAGGYAYVADTTAPGTCTLLPLKPVVEVIQLPAHGLIVFAGFHTLAAWDADGAAWETARLSWEGLRLTHLEDGRLSGFGWNALTDREMPFSVDLANGQHSGGGYGRPAS